MLIPTPLVSVLFAAASQLFVHFVIIKLNDTIIMYFNIYNLYVFLPYIYIYSIHNHIIITINL